MASHEIDVTSTSSSASDGPASTGLPSPIIPILSSVQVGAVVDINNGSLHRTMRTMFIKSMTPKAGIRTWLLPTAFLFDNKGLQIWSQITRSATYHQTNDEIQLLEKYGKDIASYITDGSILIDIGAG